MQQTKSYWRLVAVAGVVGACLASACVVTTSTDGNGLGGDTSTAGVGTTPGGSAGATSAGGSAGSAGATAAAGTGGGAPAGGTGAVTVACDMGEAGAMTGTPAATCNATAGNACSACLQTTCCAEVEACNGTNPNNQCAFGGPDGTGEFNCVTACMKMAFATNGNVELPDDLPTCGGKCSTDACGTVIGTSTSILVGCAHGDDITPSPCRDKCFQ
jgi:hypothetical protein